jgi:hypothetical protein
MIKPITQTNSRIGICYQNWINLENDDHQFHANSWTISFFWATHSKHWWSCC